MAFIQRCQVVLNDNDMQQLQMKLYIRVLVRQINSKKLRFLPQFSCDSGSTIFIIQSIDLPVFQIIRVSEIEATHGHVSVGTFDKYTLGP